MPANNPPTETGPRRVVIDTNILVGSAYAPTSASGRILAAVFDERLAMIVSPALLREYHHILPRAVRNRTKAAALLALAESALRVEPESVPRVVLEDPTDDKFVAAALAGQALALITNDRAVLEIDPHSDLRVLRPSQFVALWMA